MRGREEGIRKREDGKEHMYYRLQNKDIKKEGRKKEEIRHFPRLSHDIVCT